MGNIIVSKFGGTSVGSPPAIRNLGKIVFQKKERRVIVVSAVSGVTDMLIKLAQSAAKGANWKKKLEDIKRKHKSIIKELDLDLDLSIYFNELESILDNVNAERELSPRNRDYILSFGERMSAKIVEQYLKEGGKNIKKINAKHFIKTDSTFGDAKLDWKKTEKAIRKVLVPILEKHEKIIVTGFIGANPIGEYTTFSRGGSDYTASIIASLLSAKELEIWTDVTGILTADPRIIPEARIVENISYREAEELAYFGAKVLHPKTIKPVVADKIPVRVLNTFDFEKKGTLISADSKNGIKSISCKKGAMVINLYSAEMVESYGFLAKIFAVFLKYKVVADVVSTSEASISVTVDSEPADEFLKELEKHAEVEVLPGKTIICIVGKGINSDKSVPSRIFNAINIYPVRIISQNSSAKNVTVVVDEKNHKEIIRLIYGEFFK